MAMGPYELPVVTFESCKGPKKSNLTSVSSSVIRDEKGEWIFSFNLTILEEVKLDQGPFELPTVKYNVCKGPKKRDVTSISSSMNLDEKGEWILSFNLTCLELVKLDQGIYSLRLNMNEILRSFLGTSFFYGDYIFKTHITSKTGNILCTESFIRFSKKGEGKKAAVASSKAA
ncbi:hypothetical protein KGM_205648 [Danaus plexippus plexippus]|uniref:Uncharacterized protein n=1 Tax=Danaus plexippus plexippus TaxID=278856 RepID=A0A212ERE1_DANPL|nr:hypothetical protein KGM_205648 [Danaus plexippus plexippus]